MTMLTSRRSFLGGLIASPAVVAATSLMPVRGFKLYVPPAWCPPGWVPLDGQTFAREQYPVLWEAVKGHLPRYVGLPHLIKVDHSAWQVDSPYPVGVVVPWYNQPDAFNSADADVRANRRSYRSSFDSRPENVVV